MQSDQTSGWALILTGGGNRGAIQAGALVALFETGFVPELIVGVSVGAINGSYLAFHPDLEGARAVTEIWQRLNGRKLFGGGPSRLRSLIALTRGRRSVYGNEGFRSLLDTTLPAQQFEDTKVPFAVTATHLETGTPRVLSTGNITPAVLASAAVPAYLPPVQIDGEWLIDGAIADPVPLHIAGERGLAGAVVIEPGHACACPRVYESGLSVVQQSVAVMAHRYAETELHKGIEDLAVFHLGLTCHADLPLSDLSQTSTMIMSGYEEASKELHSRTSTLPWVTASRSPQSPGLAI